VITRQPYPKGAKASPNGNHEVNMTNGIIRPPFFGGFFLEEILQATTKIHSQKPDTTSERIAVSSNRGQYKLCALGHNLRLDADGLKTAPAAQAGRYRYLQFITGI